MATQTAAAALQAAAALAARPGGIGGAILLAPAVLSFPPLSGGPYGSGSFGTDPYGQATSGTNAPIITSPSTDGGGSTGVGGSGTIPPTDTLPPPDTTPIDVVPPPPPPPVELPPVGVDPATDPYRTDDLVWVDARGNETALTRQPYLDVLWSTGVLGRRMPTFTVTESQVPGQAGAVVRNIRAAPREITLPVTVLGDDYQGMRSNVRRLIALFDPEAGPGLLRSIQHDGTARDLECRYSSGMEGREWTDDEGWWYSKQVLVLRAVQPFYVDSTDTVLSVSKVGGLPFFPFLPLVVAPDNATSTPTVVNDGDRPAEAVWVATGPASGLILADGIRDATTGLFPAGTRVLELVWPIAAGQTITVDTRQGRKSVRAADGTNLFPYLTGNPDLFPIPVGTRAITIDLQNAGGGSRVIGRFKRRWLSV